jgi:hypothetical protein
MSVLQVCEWLEKTMVAFFVRETTWGFAIVGPAHSRPGGIGRHARVVRPAPAGVSMQGCPVSVLYRRLMPWTLAGFTIMFGSGAVLFAAYATAAYASLYFRIKAAAIVLAGLNALFFHLVTERRIADWNDGVRPPLPARFAGLVSIVVWAVASWPAG